MHGKSERLNRRRAEALRERLLDILGKRDETLVNDAGRWSGTWLAQTREHRSWQAGLQVRVDGQPSMTHKPETGASQA